MTIEEAIQTALEYESRVHAAYLVAASRSEDVAAKRVFAVLADEERGHITYLQGRLLEWQREGRLSEPALRRRDVVVLWADGGGIAGRGSGALRPFSRNRNWPRCLGAGRAGQLDEVGLLLRRSRVRPGSRLDQAKVPLGRKRIDALL